MSFYSQDEQRRYVVSFKKSKISKMEAADILKQEVRILTDFKIDDGVSKLSSSIKIDPDQALHFENIGTTIISLSDEDVKKVKENNNIEQIVEDYPVYALGEQHKFKNCENEELFRAGYNRGYQTAMQEVYRNNYPCYNQLNVPSHYNISKQVSDCPPGMHPECINDDPVVEPPVCPPGMHLECVPDVPLPPEDDLQPILWNIQLINANKVWSRVTGRNVKVGIIDTGIDNNHPDISVVDGISFVLADDDNIKTFTNSWEDDNGHGTHCAGIIGAQNNKIGVVGVAPECSLFSIKVLSSSGSGQLSWILGGMGWAAEQKMDVVSMSLGSMVFEADAECSVAYQRAAQELINQGCIVIAAAGNSGEEKFPWVGLPARCSEFMAVGAIDKNKNIASFSSNGPSSLPIDSGVEICAPGVTVKSTWLNGKYKEASGTSMACPHVAGAAALLKQLHPTWSPMQIRQKLRSTAQDLGAPGNDPKYGGGLLDCYRAIFD
ncbi:MAG: subtilisin [Candidatus Magnetoglobus multicellularis str. Araruama]|uniref:Subtilisin n=1 Tax=Candidatus Magnetoglobus multicellularis str. Araruama TaxID=890399 RepID=A0A1V1P1L9_9BACT|nr:MAG: subtilisin [Candidatus Magnetoglobus multicellularis str. Araruama]